MLNPLNDLLGGLLDRWFVPDDCAGVIYAKLEFLELAGYVIRLPMELDVQGRLQLVRTPLPGLADDVKEITGFASWDITLSGIAGYFRAKTMPPIPEIPLVGGLVSGVAGSLGTLLGTSSYVESVEMLAELAGTLRKVAAGAGAVTIVDADGVLARLGITHVVPGSFSCKRVAGDKLWSWSYPLMSDDVRDPLKRLFPSEGGGAE